MSSTHDQLIIITLASLAALLITLVLLLLIYFIRQNQQSMHYNFELQRAAFTADRDFYERQLAKTAMQLTASEDRWRDANHLLLSKNIQSRSKTSEPDISSFISSLGIPRSEIEIDRKLVMVLTPFSDEEVNTALTIKNACSNVGLNAIRGDEQFISGDILSHVVKLIIQSRIVIANISTRNANVFYELGIAHAMNKPTILVARNLNDTPFDVQNYRIVVYKDDLELRYKLTESIARLMAEIGSPVRSDDQIIDEGKF